MSLFSSKESATSEVISVVAQIRAKSGHEAEVRKALAALAEPSLNEPGCLKYTVFEDKHYAGSFFTYEEWESEAALDEHLRVNKQSLDQAKALLQDDMRINVLTLIS